MCVCLLQDLLDVCDARGCTPLHLAAQHGNTEVVTYLMYLGANVMARDHANATPLHYAAVAAVPTARTPIMARFLQPSNPNVKVEVDAADHNGLTPLHWAAGVCHTAADMDGVRYLLQTANANVNATDKLGNTALHHAASSSSHPEVVSFLTWHKAKVGALNVYGDSVVHTAAGFGNPSMDMLKALVASFDSATGAPAVSQLNKAGQTPLQLAVSVGWSTAAVEVLLEKQQREKATCTGLLDLMVSCGWRVEIADCLLLQALADKAKKEDIWQALCLLSQQWKDDNGGDHAAGQFWPQMQGAEHFKPQMQGAGHFKPKMQEAGHFKPKMQGAGRFTPKLEVRFLGLVTPSNARLRQRLVARLFAIAGSTGQCKFSLVLCNVSEQFQ